MSRRSGATRSLEHLRNTILVRLAELGLDLESILDLDRSAVAVLEGRVSLTTVKRLDGAGALARQVVELDAETSLAMRLYLREAGLIETTRLFASQRGSSLTAKTARRLVRQGPRMTFDAVRTWWRQW